ncbi:TPA: DUF4158 domain-containing protein, partial [Citrobacter freundii]|nr:DUF4158 domain-containing protein [Citrobacter freundii]
MARRQILSLSERESLLALPDDEFTLTRMAYFSEHDLALISAHRKPASRFGFAVEGANKQVMSSQADS